MFAVPKLTTDKSTHTGSCIDVPTLLTFIMNVCAVVWIPEFSQIIGAL